MATTSGTITTLTMGHEPLPSTSCPIRPANSYINDTLVGIYQSRIDAIISQIGRNILLYFEPQISLCPNCEWDSFSKKSRNIYKLGGPRYFVNTVCSWCHGTGNVETPVIRCIKATVEWSQNLQDTNDMAIRTNNGLLATLKCKMDDAPLLCQAKYAIIDEQIKDVASYKAVMTKPPSPRGLATSRYCVSTWKVVS
jgi:hypothetical protein